MEITFTISDEIAKQLFSRADKEGKDVSTFMAKVAEREAKKPTLDELLAPVRQQFAESGLSEEDLTELVREERRAIQKEKSGKE
jgi:predicted CopG family antitoxin